MISEQHHEQLYTLWDTLADFPAADTDGALRFLLDGISQRIGAANALWVGTVRVQSGAAARRDAQHGWRGRVVKLLHQTPVRVQKSAQAAREQDSAPAMTTVALAAQAGKFRVHRMRDGLVDFERFRRTAHYRMLYQSLGIVDRIFVGVPVNADAESFFLFDLQHTRRRFSAADAEWAGHALRGLKWFHRRLLLSHGLGLGAAGFTAGERRVLAQLLTGAKEADIAYKLRLTPGTVHQYAVELYRKLGVKGRAGLMALWLNDN